VLSEFAVARYEIDLLCTRPMFLPPYKGSALRGALTMQFKRLVCHQPGVRSCEGCEVEPSCPYSYVFETPAPADRKGTVGFSKFPRPFVVEPPPDSRQEYAAGDVLLMGLVLFGRGIEYLPYFVVTLRELAASGLGTYRSPFALGRIHSVDDLAGRRELVYDPEDGVVRASTIRLGYEDARRYSDAMSGTDLVVRFLTCTRLMHQGRPAFRPEFHILVRNLLRRISALSTGHCGEWPDIDYKGIISRAEQVRIAGGRLEEVYWEHVSSRQGQRVPHDGIVGEVAYTGNLAEFLPLLVLGMFTHVGDSCVLGMGRYEIACQAGGFPKDSHVAI